MILKNAAGDETTRSISFTTLERDNEDVGDKSLVLFNTPRDIKGTALLSHAQILEADNQWLYLPAGSSHGSLPDRQAQRSPQDSNRAPGASELRAFHHQEHRRHGAIHDRESRLVCPPTHVGRFRP